MSCKLVAVDTAKIKEESRVVPLIKDTPCWLGRGELLEKNTQISRKQIEITFDGKSVIVQQLGVNPGSVIIKGQSILMEKEGKFKLKNGDCFTLLLNQYKFSVEFSPKLNGDLGKNMLASSDSKISKIPTIIPEKIGQKIPEKVSEKIPEKIPAKIQEKIPEKVSTKIPEKIPAKILEKIPEKVSAKIPEKSTAKLYFSGEDVHEEKLNQVPQKKVGGSAGNIFADSGNNSPTKKKAIF